MFNSACYAVVALLSAQSLAAALQPANTNNAIPASKSNARSSNGNTIKRYQFDVPVDHFQDKSQYEPHSQDFYPVQYWLEPSYYKPGGPVIVIASGETSAENRIPYLENGIGSVLAKATNGMIVSLEHRYYGTSSPILNLTTNDNLTPEDYRFLTTEQAMADAAYFAKHVQFPGFEKQNLTGPNTAWIIYGGSYAGAFAAFTRKLYPDAYWGAISSSGVTHAVYDFWEYSEATRLFAPGNCGGIMGKLTHVVDTALLSGDETKIQAMKELFGYFGTVTIEDFAHDIAHPIYALQGESWVRGESDTSLEPHCDTLTSKQLKYPDLEKNRAVAEQLVKDAGYCAESATKLLNYVGLQTALPTLEKSGNSCKTVLKEGCAASQAQKRDDVYEFDENTSWLYQKCTQWGYFVSGSGVPLEIQGILSRTITAQHIAEKCKGYFNITTPPDVEAINYLGGLNFSYPRVAIIDGKQDPWRAATAHKIGINENRQSTTSEPFILIDYATHHWDEYDVPESEYSEDYPPKQIRDVHDQEVAFVQAWLKEFVDQD